MHVENVSNYMYSKIKYSEHTNMIFFTLNGVSFISLNVRVSIKYINWMFILVIMIQNYFLLFSYLDFKTLHAKVYPDFCP